MDKKDYETGVMNEKSRSDIVIVEDYDDKDELHCIAKALPFRKEDMFITYRYNEELGYEERIPPQTMLLPVGG